ncbi:MAG: DNA adenine methylase [Prevotellaceae bacterium]|nr:DNA adenine methylase [Prevotellaceae bacterium]
MAKAKPFIKWVGGKGQLIEQIDAQLPADFGNWQDVTYIEPFVGGGAMLFYMLQRYPNIRHAVIGDINADLVTCYTTVRDCPDALVASLKEIEQAYRSLPAGQERKAFYLAARDRYNLKNLDAVENTTLFFFLNRTCFNGLYRVNKKGLFNVPFGRYANPTLCDADVIYADSALLRNVTVLNGDFEETVRYAKGNTLFYFDPPYRPLSDTSSFNDYAKETFNDHEQVRLKACCDKIDRAGYKFMLSNSDSKGKHEKDSFFDTLYAAYPIERVWASRSINSRPDKRGKLTEILVRNYKQTKGDSRAKHLLGTLFNVNNEPACPLPLPTVRMFFKTTD